MKCLKQICGSMPIYRIYRPRHITKNNVFRYLKVLDLITANNFCVVHNNIWFENSYLPNQNVNESFFGNVR